MIMITERFEIKAMKYSRGALGAQRLRASSSSIASYKSPSIDLLSELMAAGPQGWRLINVADRGVAHLRRVLHWISAIFIALQRIKCNGHLFALQTLFAF